MSAHRIYCYAPHRVAVEEFLHSVGSVISHDCPHVVNDVHDLQGLEHITFATVDNHAEPLPQRMWEFITERGALVIHIDDQYRRERRARRIAVHHYGAPRVESACPTAD